MQIFRKMKENRIKVIIKKPISDVFYFTTHPSNTHLWIPSIEEEVCDEYPPKLGTEYRNRGDGDKWNIYQVLEFEKDSIFTLADKERNYHVRYTYKKLDENSTEMEYYEWMEEGELSSPFTLDILEKLKEVVEN